MSKALPTLYIPHGGGPCFFMEWDPPDTWTSMAQWLRGLGGALPRRPDAVVVVSAHWETAVFSVTAAPQPALIYDYYGFPPQTYDIQYPAPGCPPLADRVVEALAAAGIAARLDPERGFDHGVFIPFKLIFPDADVPLIQLSLKAGLDPAEHWAVGQALAGLRQDNVLIVGSGMSYHNVRQFFRPRPDAGAMSDAFDAWLDDALTATPRPRREELLGWRAAPFAAEVHPREDHLIPLMVVAGAAAAEPARKVFSDRVMGATVSAWALGIGQAAQSGRTGRRFVAPDGL